MKLITGILMLIGLFTLWLYMEYRWRKEHPKKPLIKSDWKLGDEY